jgi:hypothetical protein
MRIDYIAVLTDRDVYRTLRSDFASFYLVLLRELRLRRDFAGVLTGRLMFLSVAPRSLFPSLCATQQNASIRF